MWQITDKDQLHIKKWENDAIIFLEGPDDTHLIDLNTASILEFLNLNPLSTEIDITHQLNNKYGNTLQQNDVCNILKTLKSLKLVEKISETNQC